MVRLACFVQAEQLSVTLRQLALAGRIGQSNGSFGRAHGLVESPSLGVRGGQSVDRERTLVTDQLTGVFGQLHRFVAIA
jgi:hypothetical protein